MLTLIGDILNWAAAGVAFPLMFLPLAATLSGKLQSRHMGSLNIWLGLVIGIVGVGILFAGLTPGLSVLPLLGAVFIYAAIIAVLTTIIALTGGVIKITAHLTPVFKFIVHRIARIIMWLLIAMALVQFGIVVLRYVFGINYIFMQESITYMHGAVFLLTAGYALLTDDHVRVDIFYSQASPKRKALIDLLGTYLLLFPICLILLWTASPYVANSWAVTEGSTETSGIQAVYILKSFIPAFAILLAMSGFNIAARAGGTLRGE